MVKASVDIFGKIQDIYIEEYTLENKNKMKVSFLSIGGTNNKIIVPDKNGKLIDVSLQYGNVIYIAENNHGFLGAVISRNCNRIEDGIAKINGVDYKLDKNDGTNNLHSGPNVFNKIDIQGEIEKNGDTASVIFKYHFENGEQGFPGNMDFSVKYTLDDDNNLYIHYEAISDKDSIFNPTSHIYFNLSGHDTNDLSKHSIMINAKKYCELKDNLIPKEEKDVINTIFDFNKEKNILDTLKDGLKNDDQVKLCKGFDHCFIIDKNSYKYKNMNFVARAHAIDTNITMEVYSDSTAVQFYTANFISGGDYGKSGKKYENHGSFCLETEYVPNAINDNRFDSPLIKAGVKKEFTTILKFSA